MCKGYHTTVRGLLHCPDCCQDTREAVRRASAEEAEPRPMHNHLLIDEPSRPCLGCAFENEAKGVSHE